MATLELRAQRRAVVGKKVAALRRDGLTPANLYGPGIEPTPLQLPTRELTYALRRIGPTSLVPLIVEDSPPRRVLVREIQRHPVTDEALHIDLFALSMTTVMRAAVPIHVIGEAPAVAEFDGLVMNNLEAIDVECLPDDLPPRLDVDISELRELHASVHVRDLTIPSGVTVLTPEDTTVVTILPPQLEPEEPEAEEAAEAAAEATGETAATADGESSGDPAEE